MARKFFVGEPTNSKGWAYMPLVAWGKLLCGHI
jgi:hypothetical protein